MESEDRLASNACVVRMSVRYLITCALTRSRLRLEQHDMGGGVGEWNELGDRVQTSE
jgi:hypothetical protein